MCGRFALYSESIADHFRLNKGHPVLPRYNIAPSQQILIIVHTSGFPNRRAGMSRWGLIPSWAKDEKIGYKMINARAETLAEKPSFRDAYRRRRCIVPATGFFEWKKSGNQKIPFFIKAKGLDILGFAGLWEKWHSPAGEIIVSSTIITTEANNLVKKIHDRMPVIIQPDQYDLWLSPSANQTTLKQLLKPYSPYKLSLHQVGNIVNKPQTDSPECVKPLTG